MKSFFPFNNKRGIGQLALILAIVAVLAVGSIGWWAYNRNKDTGVSTANKTTEDKLKNAKCDYDDQDLCKFFASWKTTDSYTVTATSKKDGKTTTIVLKSQGKDKFHLQVTGETSYETIAIGNTLYTKAGDAWYKQTVTAADITKQKAGNGIILNEPANKGDKAQQTTYKKIGKEKCGVYTCFKYQVNNPGDTTNITYMWFDNQSYQLRRIQTVSKDGKNSYDATLRYDKVTITAPSPVKELQPGQTITAGQSAPTDLPHTGDDPPTEEELRLFMQQYGQ